MIYTYNDSCQISSTAVINESIIGFGNSCGVIKLLDVNLFTIIANWVSSSGYSINGLKMLTSNQLASIDFNNGYVKVWNLNSIANPTIYKSLFENSNLFSLEIIDNDTVAIGAGLNRVSVWKVSNATRLKMLSIGLIVNSLMYFKPFGLLLCSGTNYFKFWNTTSWSLSSSYNYLSFSNSVFTKINDYTIYFIASNSLYSFSLRYNKSTRLTSTGSYIALDKLDNGLIATSNSLFSLVFFNTTNGSIVKTVTSAHTSTINPILNIPSNIFIII